MKVKELISILQSFDPEAYVVTDGYTGSSDHDRYVKSVEETDFGSLDPDRLLIARHKKGMKYVHINCWVNR